MLFKVQLFRNGHDDSIDNCEFSHTRSLILGATEGLTWLAPVERSFTLTWVKCLPSSVYELVTVVWFLPRDATTERRWRTSLKRYDTDIMLVFNFSFTPLWWDLFAEKCDLASVVPHNGSDDGNQMKIYVCLLPLESYALVSDTAGRGQQKLEIRSSIDRWNSVYHRRCIDLAEYHFGH
jgi:hypothetical protein